MFAVAVSVGAAACYSPSLGDGDLSCGPGGQCPDGYTCGADNRCYKGTPPEFDASGPVFDAAPDIDAMVQPPAPTSTQEVTSGSGHVSGGNFTMDVQVGHPMSQQPSTGGGKSAEGASAVKP